MKCKKCKNTRLRVIDMVETPILDEGKSNMLIEFTIVCLECKHEFKKEYLED